MLPEPGLYVHLPWCVRKCPYCDFNSHEPRGELPEAAYLTALIGDLNAQVERFGAPIFSSVFFGGGTPSLVQPSTIGALLDHLNSNGWLAEGAEITLEANPGTVDESHFQGFRAAGVNRLSLGIQSFSPEILKALGRIHDDGQAMRAAELAARLFPRYNLDLMYGTPGQTPAAARTDIDTALSFGPAHVSAYQLTIEANTRFFSQPPALPDEDEFEDIEDAVHEALAGAGLTRYEVSAWAREGEASRHNLNYWTFGDYIGIGAGAHGKATDSTGAVLRAAHTRIPDDYLRDPGARFAAVAEEELPFEFLLNALRLANGSNIERYEATTGLTVAAIEPAVQELVSRGWMEPLPRLATTPLGWRFLNTVLEAFLPDQRRR